MSRVSRKGGPRVVNRAGEASSRNIPPSAGARPGSRGCDRPRDAFLVPGDEHPCGGPQRRYVTGERRTADERYATCAGRCRSAPACPLRRGGAETPEGGTGRTVTVRPLPPSGRRLSGPRQGGPVGPGQSGFTMRARLFSSWANPSQICELRRDSSTISSIQCEGTEAQMSFISLAPSTFSRNIRSSRRPSSL